MIKSNFLKVALAQIAPVWLQKEQTIQKIENAIINAAKAYVTMGEIVVAMKVEFGEWQETAVF